MCTALWAGLGLAVLGLAPSRLQRDGTDGLKDEKNGEGRGGRGKQPSLLVKRASTHGGGFSGREKGACDRLLRKSEMRAEKQVMREELGKRWLCGGASPGEFPRAGG